MKKSIKIDIAGRPYSLSVEANEEPYVQKAVSNINQKLNVLKTSYIADNVDLLAMTALQIATELEKNNDQNVNEELEKTLNFISEKLEVVINETTT